MTSLEIFSIVSGVVSILSFLFAVWIWMRADMKIKELRNIIRTIDELAGTAIWEFHTAPARDYELRLRQAEKTLGFMTSIQKTAEHYSSNAKAMHDTSLGVLLDRRVLWTVSMLYDFEASTNVSEIWIISRDLKPDCSDEEVGKLINRNLRRGRKYVYFCLDDIPYIQIEMQRLLQNLGTEGTKLRERVRIVPLNRTNYNSLFSNGNLALYFRDENRSLPPKCFEEIIFTQVSERGAFWQEHSEEQAIRMRHWLETALNNIMNISDH